MTSVAVLGSTGSIGTQTLDIVRDQPDRFDVVALAAGRSVAELVAQAREFDPQLVVTADAASLELLRDTLPHQRIELGPDALAEAASFADVVINGVLGFAGLPATLSALEHGRRLGLANKESLIAAGPVVQRARGTPGAEILPVDSEHCALHQCLRSNEVFADDGLPHRVAQLVLTASGGPFLGRSADDLSKVTVADALAHPTWSMGQKITIDSSTLMNKGFEVIEAHELFGIDYDAIDVVVHRQSIVHSMATFTDGATMAQLSRPDMRLCIGYALAYPDRLEVGYGKLDWAEALSLDFEPPDRNAFRCLDLAYSAGRAGGTHPACLNAANEVVVDEFLKGAVAWVDIAGILEAVLERHDHVPADSVTAVTEVDKRSRALAHELVTARNAA